MDVMEEATPDIIKYYLGTLTQKERVSILKYTKIYCDNVKYTKRG